MVGVDLHVFQLMPSPRWRLTVDIGSTPAATQADDPLAKEGNKSNELNALIRTYTPEDKTSPLAPYLPGFTALRLLLRKRTKSDRDYELLKEILHAYGRYRQEEKSDFEVAWMVARDFMVAAKKQTGRTASTSPMADISSPNLSPNPSVSSTSNCYAHGVSEEATRPYIVPVPVAADVVSSVRGTMNGVSAVEHAMNGQHSNNGLLGRQSPQPPLPPVSSPALQPIPTAQEVRLLGLDPSSGGHLASNDSDFASFQPGS